MKKTGILLLVLVILLGNAGCVSQPHNREITVTSPDIDSLTPVNIGSVDVYSPEFRIANPTNRTFTNVAVQINLDTSLTYCHSLSKTIEIPVLAPREKRIELVSIPEFSDLYCQYTYTDDVVSDP